MIQSCFGKKILLKRKKGSRSSRPTVFCEKGVLRNFAKFTGKHLCQSLFFNKFLFFIKKETLAQTFSCEFYEISKNTFFTEHLRWLLLELFFRRYPLRICLNPIQGGLFRGCSRMGGGEKASLPEICHTYPTMVKLGTVIPYLKKIQNIYKSRDTPLEFC